MVMLYFSGTGNSKYIAKLFCSHINAKCFSIEDKIDFAHLIVSEEIIGFCYPIYGSRVPRIMREFVKKYTETLKNKKVIIFCTQWIFSGDGARAFTDILPRDFNRVIYAEHFRMPNNVNNLFFLPLASERAIKKYKIKSEQKMKLVCHNIKSGIIKKRGFNALSRILGLMQGTFIPKIEKQSMNKVWISGDCSLCRLCVFICPMDNLEYMNGKITQKNNCTICYRCINKCPKKAIKIFFHGKIKGQYCGL